MALMMVAVILGCPLMCRGASSARATAPDRQRVTHHCPCCHPAAADPCDSEHSPTDGDGCTADCLCKGAVLQEAQEYLLTAATLVAWDSPALLEAELSLQPGGDFRSCEVPPVSLSGIAVRLQICALLC
mgnify:CR=1 FL=1